MGSLQTRNVVVELSAHGDWPTLRPYDPGEVCRGEFRAPEIRAGEGRAAEMSARKVRVGKSRAGEVRAEEDRANEVRSGEVCIGEVRISEINAEGRGVEVRAGEVRLSEVREMQDREAQDTGALAFTSGARRISLEFWSKGSDHIVRHQGQDQQRVKPQPVRARPAGVDLGMTTAVEGQPLLKRSPQVRHSIPSLLCLPQQQPQPLLHRQLGSRPERIRPRGCGTVAPGTSGRHHPRLPR